MNGDLVIHRIIQGLELLGGAIVIAAFAAWLVGKICDGARRPGGVPLIAQLLTPLALFYAGSLYLDRTGIVVPSTVESKNERVTYDARAPAAGANGRRRANTW